jgi:class 3 adenylate cyclase/predicted Ser/Thr protein kinase
MDKGDRLMTNPSQPDDPPTTQSEDREREGETRTYGNQPSSTELSGAGPTFPEADPTEPMSLPETFGRYTILKTLGKGGMGTVYLAQDTQLDRPVALKVPHFGSENRARGLERFYREARAAASLHHPNICPVFDVGEIDGTPYLTMAYIEGPTLREWASTRMPLPLRQAADLVQTVALALEEAHCRGVIHRDLKPSNIMIDKRQEPVVMDFGLARRINTGDERLTHLGVVLGTPAYMPPEQVGDQRDAPGPAGDIYSLGVILYELLTGQLPFHGSLTSVLLQIVSQEPAPPSHHRPDLDPALEAISLKALAKDPGRRFARMASFAQALGDFLAGKETRIEAKEPQTANPPGGGPLDPRASPDGKTIQEVLTVLRSWGWATGLRKLRTRLVHARDEPRRVALQGLVDWLSGDRHLSGEMVEHLKTLEHGDALAGWALAGQAARALRDRDYARAHKMCDRAAAKGDGSDKSLAATLAHTRGVVFFHQGKADLSLPELHEALAMFGKDHFGVGRVLDTLGMVYAGKGNFHVAREFFDQALRYKQRFEDEAGLALSHGQMGRLHLDWGQLDKAEEHFQEDLRLAQKIRDGRGEAQMYNHLGQVALARGDGEAGSGRKAAARRLWTEAAGWLEESIRLSGELKEGVAEAFARKDRALVFLREGNIAAAEAQVVRARELFDAARFAEGTAQTNRVWGMILRAQERFEESLRALRAALAHFEDTRDTAECARILWEIARTLREAGANLPLITRAYLEALERAEGCRHERLVELIEEDLRDVDQEAYFRHIYYRVRGRSVGEDTTSLRSGSSEVVTVLCFDLQGFSDFARGLDPAEVLMTLNQMMADLAMVLERYKAKVTTYFGDGFMALLREGKHAERAVGAALDLMAALQEFDRPRQLLGFPLFKARIGIDTGAAFLGNVGTYHKIDFTVLGPAVTLAARLLNWAEPGLPCISQATHEAVADRFVYVPGSPRTITPPGAEPLELWDVVGRKK